MPDFLIRAKHSYLFVETVVQLELFEGQTLFSIFLQAILVDSSSHVLGKKKVEIGPEELSLEHLNWFR